MKLTRLRQPKKARIEIIPMIDTIFFLLVFYILSSLAMTQRNGLDVELPSAFTGSRETAPSLTLTITRDGAYAVNGNATTADGLSRSLQEAARGKAANSAIVINADGNAAHRHVVWALDVARQLGMTQISIATSPAQ